jgi:phosphatidylethanolamine-binding protein (PEBP) family uncharacterized protein
MLIFLEIINISTMLLYVNNRRIPENQWFPIRDLSTLRVEWKPINQYVTLIMYDMDAPSSWSPVSSPYLHHLVVNINGNNIRTGVIVMPYTAPNPPSHSGNHRYVIALYKQEFIINEKVSQRERFDVDSLVQRYQLVLIDHAIIIVDSENMMYYVEPNQISMNPNHPLILGDSTLNDAEQRYCACLIEASSHIPQECIKKKEAFMYEDGKMCYNPFAVCAKSVGTTSRECPQNYNFNAMSDDEIEAFATLHNVSLVYPINREELFEMFMTHR